MSTHKLQKKHQNKVADCNYIDYLNDTIYYNNNPGYNYSCNLHYSISLNNGNNERIVSPMCN